MIFRSCCCNPRTTFTAGSLETYINPPAKNSITAMCPLARSARAGGRNPGPAAAGLGRWAVPGAATDRDRAGDGLGRPAAAPASHPRRRTAPCSHAAGGGSKAGVGRRARRDGRGERAPTHPLSLLYTAKNTWWVHARRTSCGRCGLARGAAGVGARVGAAHGAGTGGGIQAWGRPIAETPKRPYAGGIGGGRVARSATTSMARESPGCLFLFHLHRFKNA
jgi:hypothetical protein